MALFRFQLIGVLLICFSTSVFGLPSFFSSNSGSGGFFSFQDSHATKNAMTDTVQQLQHQLDGNQLSAALTTLKNLSSQIRENQRVIIDTYFPPQFEGFSSTSSFGPQADNGSSTSFGMVYSKHYQNGQRQSIDVNVVFSDGTVAEYANLINSPHMMKGFDNASVVKLGPYSALEKFSPSDRYLERNIVLNGDLLVNVIANGISSKDSVNTLCRLIDFAALEKYLKN